MDESITYNKVVEIINLLKLKDAEPVVVRIHFVDKDELIASVKKMAVETKSDLPFGIPFFVWHTQQQYPQGTKWFHQTPGVWLEYSDGTVKELDDVA